MSDPNFIVVHCPFNFLRIFNDVVHLSKTEVTLGPSSDVDLTYDTILLVELPYKNIHALCYHFLNPPGSGVNLTSEYDSPPFKYKFRHLLTCEHQGRKLPTFDSPILACKNPPNRLFVSSYSCHPPLREALQSHGWGMGGARFVGVGP